MCGRADGRDTQHHAHALKRRLATRVERALAGVEVGRAFHFSAERVRRPDLEDQRARYHATRLLWGVLRLRVLPGDAELEAHDAAAREAASPDRDRRLDEARLALHGVASGHAYGDLRDAGLDSLAKATRALDVARCSAGVARPDTPAADLGRHQIQDLLRVVVDETFREDEEPIRCFAAWTLAHYTLRKNDLAHVANQDAFARLASLVVDGDLVGAVSRKAKAGDLEANDYALLTVRLVARTLKNLAGHELTAALAADGATKRDESSGELRALNRLVSVGWDLVGRVPDRPKLRRFLLRGHLAEELAACDADGPCYRCTPYAIAGAGRDRRRAEAPELAVRAEAGDVVSGEAADNISVLDEAAQALERLAAHKRAREEFASHGVLQNVVALALAGNAGPHASRPGRYKFDAAVAFEALMDAPRETFQRVVTLAPDARGKHRARWLVGDVARLVVQTLEDGEARPARLALQLCARLVAHDYADGADARPHGNDVVDAGESDDDDAAHRLREGDQVLVYAAKLWEGPRSGRCVGARGDRVDVRMDRGGAFADVPVVAEAPLKGEAPVARPATAAPERDCASLFLHLARLHERLGRALGKQDPEDARTLGATCDFVEALAETAKRYLALGHAREARAVFEAVAPLCTRQLARLAPGPCDATSGTVPLYLRLLAAGHTEPHVKRHALRAVDACLLRRALPSSDVQGKVVLMAEFGLSREDASQALHDAGGDLERARAAPAPVEATRTPATPRRKTSTADAEYLASLFRALLRVEELARARDDSRRTRALAGEQARLAGMVSDDTLRAYHDRAASFRPTRLGDGSSRASSFRSGRLASTPQSRSAPGTPWTPQRQRDAETRGRTGVVDTLLYGALAERSDARDGKETDLGPVHALLRRACCGVVEASVAAVAAAAPPASKKFFKGDAVLADWRGRGTYYPGTVVAARGAAYDVRYADRETERNVTHARIRRRGDARLSTREHEFRRGDRAHGAADAEAREACRGALRALAELGARRLAAQGHASDARPTETPAFARALVTCLKCHPACGGSDRLLAVEACGLAPRLCADLNQRLGLVFPAAGGADAASGVLPPLAALAAAEDVAAAAAAARCLRVVVENSTACREALVAHGGVRALVVAYARGDARCRADVMDALAALALTAKSLAELKTDSAALLLLLRFKAAAASSTSEASAQTTAHAERALGHIAASPALVFVYALQTCAKQVDKFQRPWVKDARRGWVLADAPDRDASVGVGLLRPGIDDLLRLACNGVEAEARHGGAADVLVSHGALKLLDDIIKVRDAAVVATVAGALASLLQQVGSRPCDDATRNTCKDVADRLLSLVWPLSHRAARTVQQAFMRKRHNQNWGGCALVVATPRLVGLLALALERADLHLDLGLYLVRRGALDALAARLAPDGHARDEVFGARVDDSHLGLGDRHAAADAVRASVGAAPRHLPPVVQVLSALARLAVHAPPHAPAGNVARSLSIVGAFHRSPRCRHLATLALRRLRPQAATRGDAFFGLRAGDERPTPPHPRTWSDDDAATWLGAVGFGAVGAALRAYLADVRDERETTRKRAGRIVATKRERRAALLRRSRASIDADLGAGALLLRLAARDVDAAGALGAHVAKAGVHLDVEAFCAELRELHLRGREAEVRFGQSIRLPRALLDEEAEATDDHANGIVVLSAAHVRRYRALVAEAEHVLRRCADGTDRKEVDDLTVRVLSCAKQALDTFDKNDDGAARRAAREAVSVAKDVRDAVALHRVKVRATTGGEDTLWYELSAHTTLQWFKDNRERSRRITGGDDVCLWPSDGAGPEAARARMHRRSKRTPESMLQKYAAIRAVDARGLAHCFEVRIVNPDALGEDKITALMGAARDSDIDTVKLLYDGVDAEVQEARRGDAPTQRDARYACLPWPARPDAWDATGKTALHHALLAVRASVEVSFEATAAAVDVARLLLDRVGDADAYEFGADVNTFMAEDVPDDLVPRPLVICGSATFEGITFEDANRPTARESFRDAIGGVVGREVEHLSLARVAADGVVVAFGIGATADELTAAAPGAKSSSWGSAIGASPLAFGRSDVQPWIAAVASKLRAAEDDPSLLDNALAAASTSCGLYTTFAKVKTTSMDLKSTTAAAIAVESYGAAVARGTAGLGGEADAPRDERVKLLDGLLAHMFARGIALTPEAVALARKQGLLERIRYVYVEHVRDRDALKEMLVARTDVFLRSGPPAEGEDPVAEWERPVFKCKNLQDASKKMWDERHRFLNNQKIFRYLLFMTMVLVVAFCWVGMDVVFLSRDGAQQAVAMRFVDEEWSPGNTFMELATPGDWWAWAEGPLLDALYEDPLPVWDSQGRPRAAAAPQRRFPLLGGLGTAVGAPRLRMLATKPGKSGPTGACGYGRLPGAKSDRPRLADPKEESFCFSYYSKETELVQNLDATDARVGNALAHDPPGKRAEGSFFPPWRWRAPKVYGYQKEFFGYPGAGGYLAHFPRDPEAGAALVEGLKNTSWISANTRAVFFEAVVYAPADHWGYNLLVEVALNAEFSPTGAVVTSGRVQSSRIFLYDTWRDFVRLVLEVLVVLYVWYFEMREEVQQITLKALSGDAAQSEIKALREWRRNFASALGEYWNAHFNFLDVMRIHVLYVWIVGVHVCGVWFTQTIPWRDLMFDERDPTAYVKDAADVSFALQLARVRMMFVALYVALCFLKLLNIMRVQDDLFVIIIIEMFKKVISFLIVVLIIVSGFAFFAFFSRIGGSQAAMGGTPDKIGGGDVFWHTLFQQFAQLNGDFDFAESWHTAQLAGVAWTLFALIVLPILLMNLLIAIMSEAYEEVKAHAAARFCHLQLDTHSDEYARKRRQRLGSGTGKGYTWEFLTQWMVLIFASVFFPFLALYDLYCRACASLRALYKYTEGFFEIEEEFAGTETLARRQARRCFYACFARTRASGAKVVPTTPKGGAAAFDDETLLRESRRRSVAKML